MARRKGIGAEVLKYFPILAVFLALYQYYRDAGGIPGFLEDIKHFNMEMLEQKWTTIAIGIAFFAGSGIVSRYVPGKMKYVAEAIMIYIGTSQLLSVLQGMYVYAPPEVQGQGALSRGSRYTGGAY